MKATKIISLMLLLSCTLAFAEDFEFEEGNATSAFTQITEEGSALELVGSWQALAAIGVMVSLLFIAIGYMIGIAFELPELKAWAGTELGQVVANAILVVILIAVIGFLDTLVMLMINGAEIGGLRCDIGESCLQEVVTSDYGYLSDYISAAKNGAANALGNNMIAAAWANRRMGLSCTTIYCAMASIMINLAPQYVLDVDRYTMIYEYWVNILASLHAQKFFVDQIGFRLGPLLLALGIVGRSFFFTRKLGGLLIAIAAGVMFFFPMMYVFDWMTLDMVIAGDRLVEEDVRGCPPECAGGPALAYYYTSGDELVQLQSLEDIYMLFDPESDSEADDKARTIYTGELDQAVGSNGTADGRTVYSCWTPAYEDCDTQCRALPYPHSLNICNNQTDVDVPRACAEVPVECKVIRLVPSALDDPEYQRCPADCKIVPPLRNDCDEGSCLDSRQDCRVAKTNDIDWRPTVEGPKATECEYAADCPASADDAYESCVYVIPEFGLCDDLCVNCPVHCRLTNADWSELPEGDRARCFSEEGYDPADPSTWTEENLVETCKLCTSTCKVDVEFIEDALDTGNCTTCPPEMRLISPSLPENYTLEDCNTVDCPSDVYNRAEMPRSSCEACLYSEESHLYSPPINADCGTLCKPSDNVPSKRPGEYSTVDEEGMVGKPEIVAVSKYIIPAYVLPLFNIVATLVFIKGFSVILGGDIEIPGLSKVF